MLILFTITMQCSWIIEMVHSVLQKLILSKSFGFELQV